MQFQHIPVLLNESISMLKIIPGGVYVDCTVGGGGHFLKILEAVGDNGIVVGIDRDENAISAVKNKIGKRHNIILVHENFRNIKKIMRGLGFEKANGILYDLGVSSYQLDEKERGFTYKEDAPLDMRMDKNQKLRAEDLVNDLPERELAQIIKEYGEERWAARISNFIVKYRMKERIKTTGQLVEIIKKAIPAGARRTGPHPAKRTFQALRIAVNGELESLRQSLYDAVDILISGGRLCIISFHSLEDRIVKQTFNYFSSECICPPGLPVCKCNKKKLLEVVTKKPITPEKNEIEDNPRSRSAKLRAAQKV
ncbi:Ribosomal RNA small subunit methyltransferase H [Koleobacter methoxysyntrophicus]|uniref:Ribosomal RNA small subunit methyltransferase H n=1 Tax=Koleobacter methoxysyntrophicus TaxID=2751313 RepID=A0A8A0RQC9_9FIRM|nr:16S rRNA (cytosine(1402)-N(4))-methyltransferase RsmH [Koleobacter methoxysyntrophicus]QSQ09729.1 Ribosomal RNA small subunit methyltransferase H [Koleobacter methoxysyntrophicus]